MGDFAGGDLDVTSNGAIASGASSDLETFHESIGVRGGIVEGDDIVVKLDCDNVNVVDD
jgi:hypothetical protein